MQLSNTLVIFDLETTGVWVEKDKIIEIAMIKCHPDGNQEVYYKKVNPGIPIPPKVSELIGIVDDDIKDAPFFRDIAHEVKEFIAGSDFAGFNVERFDFPLLLREMSEAGINLETQNVKIYDVQKVYHLNEKRDLTAAYKFYCDKSLDNAHSALADTEATFEILKAQIEKYGNGNNIDSLSEFDYKQHAEFYDQDRKFRWWNGKLYMMFGKYARKYSLQELVRKDKGYLEWILSAQFSEEIKELITNAINGQFPIYNGDSQKD